MAGTHRLAASVLLVLTSVTAAQAQTTQPPISQTSGSVPTGTATADVRRLTLRDAIGMALAYNLGAVESAENSRAARGQRLQALSTLLPQVSFGALHNRERVTSASFGFSGLPGFPVPSVIGPFGFSTASASVNQVVFNIESIQRLRAAQTAEQAALLSHDDTLDLVTLSVGNAYLRGIEAASRIEATEAQVRQAQALNDRAAAAFAAGTSPKIDVTRTSVELHTEQYNLTIARNNLAIAKLTLARAIGLPLGQQFELADSLPYADIEPQSVDEALRSAYNSRADLRASQQNVETAQHQVSATRAQRYPAFAVNGDWGWQGRTFDTSQHIFNVLAAVNVPIFTGGRISSEQTQNEAALRQREAEREDLRGQIDYDVRTALLNLQAAKEQVAVARENVDLANENLSRSQDRFAAGVTDSVEVVQAQQALSNANDQYISGTYSHNLAKLQFARAIGVARTSYDQYLTGRPERALP
ncbi:MAG TPA: TolC family protein [Vicinamibacterales bacterium]|nr:TolC family protein [Vicinamibacterales bacterium]